MRFSFSRPLPALVIAAAAFAAFVNACSADVLPSTPPREVDDHDADVVTPDDEPFVDAGTIARDAETYEPPVACGAEFPGPKLVSGFEAQPGFADELAAVDLDNAPDVIDYASESALMRGVINYLLGRASGTQVARAEALDAGVFGQVVVAAAAREDGGIDVPFLRRGLHYAYPCSRPLPPSLDEVVVRYGDYHAWPSTLIECARPKNGPRRLYTNPTKGVFIAETVSDAGVRETEILFTRLRPDGQLDFAAYTESGELTNRSVFATASSEVTGAAPFTCMTCHLDLDTGSFTRLFPSGTGAGCKQ